MSKLKHNVSAPFPTGRRINQRVPRLHHHFSYNQFPPSSLNMNKQTQMSNPSTPVSSVKSPSCDQDAIVSPSEQSEIEIGHNAKRQIINPTNIILAKINSG